jgi:hypothetical protein
MPELAGTGVAGFVMPSRMNKMHFPWTFDADRQKHPPVGGDWDMCFRQDRERESAIVAKTVPEGRVLAKTPEIPMKPRLGFDNSKNGILELSLS